VGLRERRLNMGHNAFEVRHHIVIGNAQDLVAKRSAVMIAPFVMMDSLIVACAVKFDDKLQFPAQEISEIRTDRHLAAELVSQLSSLQALPQ